MSSSSDGIRSVAEKAANGRAEACCNVSAIPALAITSKIKRVKIEREGRI